LDLTRTQMKKKRTLLLYFESSLRQVGLQTKRKNLLFVLFEVPRIQMKRFFLFVPFVDCLGRLGIQMKRKFVFAQVGFQMKRKGYLFFLLLSILFVQFERLSRLQMKTQLLFFGGLMGLVKGKTLQTKTGLLGLG